MKFKKMRKTERYYNIVAVKKLQCATKDDIEEFTYQLCEQALTALMDAHRSGENQINFKIMIEIEKN